MTKQRASHKMADAAKGIKLDGLDEKDILIPVAGDEGTLPEVLKALLQSRGLSPAKVYAETGIRPSHLSRWLNPLYREQIPVGVVKKIAPLVGRSLLLALPRVRLSSEEAGTRSWPLSSPLLRDFFVGMVGVSLREKPISIARHIAETWGAHSWTLYSEDPRKNVLSCVTTGGIENIELMCGLSWASELPMQVVKEAEGVEKTPSDIDDRDAWLPKRPPWDGLSGSVFAKREDVQYAIPLPILSDNARAVVLFLNFKHEPPAEKRHREALTTVANELRGAVEQVWGTQRMQGKMDKGQCPWDLVLAAIRAAISEGPIGRIDATVTKALERAAKGLWGERDVTCKVNALKSCFRCQEGKPAFDDESFSDNVHPDRTVKRSAIDGETFYIDDLNEHNVRGRFDPDDRIRMGLTQKLVVPLRSEPFLDWGAGLPAVAWDDESEGHRILEDRAPSKDFVSWGAVSVDSLERVFSLAQLQELNILAHIVSCCLYLRLKAQGEKNSDKQAFFRDLFKAARATLVHIEETSWEQDVRLQGGPLDPLCEAIVTKKLMGDFERCDVYPYDRLAGEFRNGGCYTTREWLDHIDTRTGGSLVKDGAVKYLRPRKGGNSERLLGVRSEFLVIPEARKHPRVSPVTKIIETKALIGCSCRIGCSFRSEAVLWLGTPKNLSSEHLEIENGKFLWRLRVIAHVAGLFCAALRWWAPDALSLGVDENTT